MSMTVCGLAECVFWLACSLRQGGQHVLGSRRGSRMELPPLQPHRCTKTAQVQFPLPTTVNMSSVHYSLQDFQVCVCLSTGVLRFLATQDGHTLTLSSLTFCACACACCCWSQHRNSLC